MRIIGAITQGAKVLPLISATFLIATEFGLFKQSLIFYINWYLY